MYARNSVVALGLAAAVAPALGSYGQSAYLFAREDNSLHNLGSSGDGSGALAGGLSHIFKSLGLKREEVAELLGRNLILDARDMSMSMNGGMMSSSSSDGSTFSSSSSSSGGGVQHMSMNGVDISMTPDGKIFKNGQPLCPCGSGADDSKCNNSKNNSTEDNDAQVKDDPPSSRKRATLQMGDMTMGPNGMHMPGMSMGPGGMSIHSPGKGGAKSKTKACRPKHKQSQQQGRDTLHLPGMTMSNGHDDCTSGDDQDKKPAHRRRISSRFARRSLRELD